MIDFKAGDILKQDGDDYIIYLKVLKKKQDKRYKNYKTIEDTEAYNKYYLVKILYDSDTNMNSHNFAGEILNWYIGKSDEKTFKVISKKEMIMELL